MKHMLHKTKAWLTAMEDIEENRKVDMYLKKGLARIDNVFMMSRQLFQSLERPIGTSSGYASGFCQSASGI